MSKCKYKDEGACRCETYCDEDELDAQMLFSVVVLVLTMIGFAVWSLWC